MGADFSQFKKLEVNGDTLAEYVFMEIAGEPSIFFAPCTEANKDFYNESVRQSVIRAEEGPKRKAPRRGMRRAEMVTAEDLEDARERDRDLISRFGAKRWEKIVDKDGVPVEFSAEECLNFFRALPNYIFDPVRTWVTNPLNFVQADLAESAGTELGKA